MGLLFSFCLCAGLHTPFSVILTGILYLHLLQTYTCLIIHNIFGVLIFWTWVSRIVPFVEVMYD